MLHLKLCIVANNVENNNTTVVYTIPTTGQLNTAYPDLQRQHSNGRPPPYVPAGKCEKKQQNSRQNICNVNYSKTIEIFI